MACRSGGNEFACTLTLRPMPMTTNEPAVPTAPLSQRMPPTLQPFIIRSFGHLRESGTPAVMRTASAAATAATNGIQESQSVRAIFVCDDVVLTITEQ